MLLVIIYKVPNHGSLRKNKYGFNLTGSGSKTK